VYMKEVASSNEISVQINNPLHSQKDVPQIDST
jgi:hypothetical protein